MEMWSLRTTLTITEENLSKLKTKPKKCYTNSEKNVFCIILTILIKEKIPN